MFSYDGFLYESERVESLRENCEFYEIFSISEKSKFAELLLLGWLFSWNNFLYTAPCLEFDYYWDFDELWSLTIIEIFI